MKLIAANGMSFDSLDVSPSDARSAIYAVMHRETKRVYIGMTASSVAYRWRQHCYDAGRPSRKYHFGNAMRAYGTSAFDVFVLDHGLQPSALPAWESHYVKLLSADVKQFGFNSTAGGDVSPASHPDVRAKISASSRGKVISAEHRANLAKAGRGRIVSEETRLKIGNGHRGKHVSDEARFRLSQSHRGNRHSAETRAKMSASQLSRIIANPDIAQKHSAAMRERWANPEYKQRTSASLRKVMSDPAYRARRKEQELSKEYSPELRAKLSASAHRRWNKIKESENS